MRRTFTLITLIACGLAVGCEDQDLNPELETSWDEVQEEVAEGGEALGDYTAEQLDRAGANIHEQYVAMKDNLREFYDNMDTHMEEANEEAREQWQSTKQSLREARENFDEKWERFQDATAEAKDDAQEEMREAWENLQESYEAARREYREERLEDAVEDSTDDNSDSN